MQQIIEEDGERAYLRVHYETKGHLTAREIGAVCDRIALSVEQFDRSRPPDTHYFTLTLDQVRAGSIIADLVAITSGFRDLYAVREVLAGFVTHLRDVLNLILSRGSSAVESSDRITMEALAKPIAHGDAIAISITVNGSNNEFNFGQEEALQIMRERPQLERVADRIRPRKIPEPNRRIGEIQEAVKQEDKTSLRIDDDRGFLRDYSKPMGNKSVDQQDEDAISPARVEEFPEELPPSTRIAILRKVDEDWFAMPQDYGSILIPVPAEANRSLSNADGTAIGLGYVLIDARGAPRKFQLLMWKNRSDG